MKLLRHDLHTLTGAYALDAIDGTERERFEHHLVRCQPCEYEVRGLQDTATRLAQAVAAQPPEQMKPRVLAAVARTRQLPPVPDARPLPPPRAGWTGGWPSRSPLRALRSPSSSASCSAFPGTSSSTANEQQRAIAAVLNAPDARLVRGRRRSAAPRPLSSHRSCMSSSSPVPASRPWLTPGSTSCGSWAQTAPPRPRACWRWHKTGRPRRCSLSGLHRATGWE